MRARSTGVPKVAARDIALLTDKVLAAATEGEQPQPEKRNEPNGGEEPRGRNR